MNKPKNNPPTQKEHRMSKWQNIRLGDIADFSNGINFDKSSYCENGPYLIGVSDFGEELFPDYSTLRHIDSTIVRECNLLKDGDIVFVRSNGNKALVGRSMLIKNPPENTSFSGFCIRARIKNHESFDPLFFAYLFKSENFRKAIAGCSIGANIQNLSQGKLASYMAYVPSIEIQRKIADILSAYDDLIENNRKQIKLLEEAAQRLYKEWFIDLRFPGYENTKIINGIPEGWEKTLLGNLIEIKYGKDHKNIPNGNIPVYGSGGFMRKCSRALHNGEAVLIPRKGSLNNIMYVNETFWTVDTMFYALMNQQNIGFFVYFLLKSFDMYAMNIGAAVPSMTTSILNAIDVVLPNATILEDFHNNVNALFKRVSTLNKQNDKLMETRNRLLTKLL